MKLPAKLRVTSNILKYVFQKQTVTQTINIGGCSFLALRLRSNAVDKRTPRSSSNADKHAPRFAVGMPHIFENILLTVFHVNIHALLKLHIKHF